jgi:hypothetical protein
MNIYTVRDNLKNTIAGKEAMLSSHQLYLRSAGTSGPENTAIYATVQFLGANIDELKRILEDVEVCCKQHTEMGWVINPERMGQ